MTSWTRSSLIFETMRKKRKTRLTPEFWARDAALRREVAERVAYHELQHGGLGAWKEALDAETRTRIEQRADEILAESARLRGQKPA
jgi:hypothetical protein